MSWEVLALRYAARPSTRGNVFYRYEEYGEADGPQEMAYYFWLLRDGDTTILVDSGYSARGGARRGRGHLVAPLDALAGVGVEVGDVDVVVNTHLHYDHTGHLDRFPDAPLLVNGLELDWWTGPLAARAHFAMHVEPEEVAGVVAADAAGRVVRMGAEHAVADGVVAIEVGGHSPGQTIVVVETARGPVVLASDAVHFYEELERDYACGVLCDLAAVYRAYDAIRALERERGAIVVAGHDPLVLDRFDRLPGAAGAHAVRIA